MQNFINNKEYYEEIVNTVIYTKKDILENLKHPYYNYSADEFFKVMLKIEEDKK